MIPVCSLELYAEAPQTAIRGLTCGMDAPPRTLSWLGLQIVVILAFEAMFTFGCKLAQFGVVYTVTSVYCFYFFSFNDWILKLAQIIFFKKVEIACLCVTSGSFVNESFEPKRKAKLLTKQSWVLHSSCTQKELKHQLVPKYSLKWQSHAALRQDVQKTEHLISCWYLEKGDHSQPCDLQEVQEPKAHVLWFKQRIVTVLSSFQRSHWALSS